MRPTPKYAALVVFGIAALLATLSLLDVAADVVDGTPARASTPPAPTDPVAAVPPPAPEPAPLTVLDESPRTDAPLPTPGHGRILGRIRGHGGQELAGATIVLHDGVTGRVTRSDGDGAFAFTDLEPGAYQVRAFEPGHAPFIGAGKVGAVTVRAAETRAIGLHLRIGRRVTGIVVAKDGATPVPGAEVTLADPALGSRVTTRTAGDGSFALDRVPVTYDGSATQPVLVRGDGFAPMLVALADTARGPLRIELDRGTRLHGRVTNGRGGPVRNARIRCAFRHDGFARVTHIESRTDGAGYYAVDHVPAGLVAQVWAHKPGYRSTFMNLILGDDAGQKLVPPLELHEKSNASKP